jgi:hypothetical protein
MFKTSTFSGFFSIVIAAVPLAAVIYSAAVSGGLA